MNADLFPENGGERLPWKPPSQINEMKRQKLLLNHFAVTAPNIYTTVGNNLDRHVAHKIILSALFLSSFYAIAIMSGIGLTPLCSYSPWIFEIKVLYVLMLFHPPYFFFIYLLFSRSLLLFVEQCICMLCDN